MTIFDNCLIQAPDGTNLSRCGKKKLRWYIERDLAYKVCDNPPTIRLKFEPSGRRGLDDPLLLDGKPNICVVCGTDEDLTRHHIIPYSFIRYMQIEYKVDVIRDIFPLCRECHNDYEKKSLDKRQELAERFNVPMFGIDPNEYRKVRRATGAARTLHKYGVNIPEDRRSALKEMMKEFLDKDEVTDEDIKTMSDYKITQRHDYVNFSKYVAGQVDDYNEFAKEWRTHFVETMKPKHMPSAWKIDRETSDVWVPQRMLKQPHPVQPKSRRAAQGS